MESMTFRQLTDQLTILYTQGQFAEALELVEQNADSFPDKRARTTFWRMCLLSLENRPEETISVFQEGLESGLWWHEELFSDPDLNAVRDLPEFPHPWLLKQLGSAARYPEDHTLGKQAQIKVGSAVIPFKSECEGGAGVWIRIRRALIDG